MARFRQFTKRQLWQRFLVQKVPTFYMIVDKLIYKHEEHLNYIFANHVILKRFELPPLSNQIYSFANMPMEQ
jgi:hypothetical protein